jgi:hypothetical protein
MKQSTARLLRALFWVYVVGTFAQIAYVVNRETYAFDAWNVSIDTGAKPASIGNFLAFWHQQYTTSNPRIGQPMTYLAYKIAGVGELGTATAAFAIIIAAFALGVGRLPSRKRGRDLAVIAIGIGMFWIAGPNLPAYMFCRAYATNYIWAIAIQLWFLVPIRLYGLRDERISTWKLALYGVLGVIAGMCNEHTGPTLIVFLLGFALWSWRSRARTAAIVWVAPASALVGFALIFFAPGQSQRYEGLAEHYSAVQQVLVRGVSGNLDILLDYLHAAAPILAVTFALLIAGFILDPTDDTERRLAQRRAFGYLALALVAGVLITATVFASPKLGPRFYFHAVMLLLGGLLAIAAAFVQRTRALAPFVVLAVVVSVVAGLRTIPLYSRMKRASDERLAVLASTAPGTVGMLDGWEQITENWWTLGDDARDQKKQEMIAQYFGLQRVIFRGNDRWKTLGVTDVKLTMQYETDPAVCLDEIENLDLKPFTGRDIAAIHHSFLDEITQIQRDGHTSVKQVDLVATFLGPPPPLPPSKRLYVARYHDGTLEGYTAGIRRAKRAHAREVVLSPELKQADMDLYVMRVGDQPLKIGTTHSATLTYEPTASGTYWITACRAEACFVVFATNHVI